MLKFKELLILFTFKIKIVILQISEQLTAIVSHTKPQVSVEAVYKMIELIQLLKEVPKETVKQLITELEEKKV